MNEKEVGYVAGFFEGEGSVAARTAPGDGHTRIRAELSQTSRWPLDRCVRILGFGKVYGPLKHGADSPMFQLLFTSEANVKRLWDLIGDQLSPRRQAQFEKAFTNFAARELRGNWQAKREQCPHGHPLDGRSSRGRYCKACNRINSRWRWLVKQGVSREEAVRIAETGEEWRPIVVEAS